MIAAHQGQAEESKQAQSVAPTSLSESLIESLNALSDQLIEQRKQLKPPSSYPQRENISEFREALNGTLRIATDGATVDTLDISTAPSGAILTTTSNNEIKLLDASGALSETLPIDNRVTLAKFAPNSDSIAIFVFASKDNQASVAQVWDLKGKQKVYEVQGHTSAITDVSFAPKAGLIAVGSADSSWSLHDFEQGKTLLHLRDQGKITSLQFHPDGLIMAIGLASGKIQIYDIRDMQLAQELDGPASAAVSQLLFSNKGIFLAAAWEGQDTCRVYSLHKGFAFAEVRQDGQAV